MKKLILLISGIVLSATVSTSSAQQLPNNSFTDWKSACGSSDQISSSGETTARKRPGVEPTDWNGSNVRQVVGVEATKDDLVTKETAGYTGDCVCLTNRYVGINTTWLKIGDEAPGYITFGTPWVYAETSISNCDGGTYGGMNFAYRPDAFTGYFKRTSTNASEKSYVIAYLWDGTFVSKVGKKGDAKGDKNDVDRAVMASAGISEIPETTASQTGTLVAYCNHSFTSTTNNDWQELTIPLTYKTTSTVPSKMNLIICAGDYWNRDGLKENTCLYVDDVKCLYYSRLTDLTVGGHSIPLVDGVYDYNVYETNLSGHSATVLGLPELKTVTADNNTTDGTYTVTVTNNSYAPGVTGVTDIDGFSSHSYRVHYLAQTTGYAGVMDFANGSFITDPTQIQIDYMKEAEGTYALTFSDDNGAFEFDDEFGPRTPERTLIKGVTMTVDSDGCYVFTKDGETQGSNYTVSLVNDGSTKCIYDPADGRWIFNFDVNYNGCVTRVTVTSDVTLSGVNGMNEMNERVVARSGAIEVSGFDGVAEVYTVDGRLVAKTTVAGNAQIAASNGIYLVRTPNTVKKVVVR
ncbi:MAG: PCMD domain-containing protein [Candidatus Limisoma sp.]